MPSIPCFRSMWWASVALSVLACGGLNDGTPRAAGHDSEEAVEDAEKFVSACASEEVEVEAESEPPAGLRTAGRRVGVAVSASRLDDTLYANTAAR